MKILCIGDIVGSSGRSVVQKGIAQLKQTKEIDLIIANGENAAHGKGITHKIYHELLDSGIDVLTMGNHTFANEDIYAFIDDAKQIVRPANMEPSKIGVHTLVVNCKGKRLAISNVCGEVWMNHIICSPFEAMQSILDETIADIYIVDFHGEATSEKIAFVYAFVNRVQVIVGTHTHVQTADERIIESTAAISDLGMCGVYHSILGRDINEIVTRFTTSAKTKYTLAKGPGIFCGALITIDETSNKAVKIERIQIRPE